MAHHQRYREAVEGLRLTGQLFDLRRRHAEPRHAAVDLDRCRQFAAGLLAGLAPGLQLRGAVDDGAKAGFDRLAFRARRQPVQHMDRRLGTERLAQRHAFGQMRDEEGRAAFRRQCRRHFGRAQPIAVSLDDAGAMRGA
jgi:hypothetical protein